jgi:hypothetical protein
MSDAASNLNNARRSMDKKEEILRAANILFDPGQPVEVRFKGRDGEIASRYYKTQMAAVLAKEDVSDKWAAA